MGVRGCRVPCRGQRNLEDYGGKVMLARSTWYPKLKVERLRRLRQVTLRELHFPMALHKIVPVPSVEYPDFQVRYCQLTLHESLVHAQARQSYGANLASATEGIDVIRTRRAGRTRRKTHGLSPGSFKKYRAAVARIQACRIRGPFYGPQAPPPEAVDRDSIRVDLLPAFAAAGVAPISRSGGTGVLTDLFFRD
jgi:hypothetical protein